MTGTLTAPPDAVVKREEAIVQVLVLKITIEPWRVGREWEGSVAK